jgi:hypothetical protein
VYRNAVGLAFAPADGRFDYVWFVPSGAVKDDLRHGTLTALPVTSPAPVNLSAF